MCAAVGAGSTYIAQMSKTMMFPIRMLSGFMLCETAGRRLSLWMGLQVRSVDARFFNSTVLTIAVIPLLQIC